VNTVGESAAEVRGPGRPRSAQAERAILAATLDLLAEEAGVAAVSIEAVAARAGVGKTTIYRRWSSKESLIVDALATIKNPLPEPAGVSVRADLLMLAQAMCVEQDAKYAQCFWNVMGGANKHPDLVKRYYRELIEPRRAVLRGVLQRGITTGELRADIDVGVVLAMLVGSLTRQGRPLPRREPLPGDYAERVVDSLLRGIAGGHAFLDAQG
jgi:AcrR family transcriptional regulator